MGCGVAWSCGNRLAKPKETEPSLAEEQLTRYVFELFFVVKENKTSEPLSFHLSCQMGAEKTIGGASLHQLIALFLFSHEWRPYSTNLAACLKRSWLVKENLSLLIMTSRIKLMLLHFCAKILHATYLSEVLV